MPLVEFWNRATALLQKMGLPLNICQPTNVNDSSKILQNGLYDPRPSKQQFRIYTMDVEIK
jgi:hypothetical protein